MASSTVPIKYPANKLSEHVTLEVSLTGYKFWSFKIKIALFLIRIAAYIAGFKHEITLEDE
jgi:hypothetical protein